MGNINLGKFVNKKPKVSYLRNSNTEPSQNIKKENKNNKKSKSEKIGRPMTTDEPLNHKITINLSETEIRKLKLKIGQVPAATFLRDVLKKAGMI